jgi:hypothetical protein
MALHDKAWMELSHVRTVGGLACPLEGCHEFKNPTAGVVGTYVREGREILKFHLKIVMCSFRNATFVTSVQWPSHSENV